MGEGGRSCWAHVVCAFAPLSALVGSHQLGNWASGKICEQIPPPQLCKIDFTTPSHGASAHTYTQGGQARPTRGLIYATSDLAKPTQRERLSLSPPQQRSLAPIVNGLLTVDVKWFFCRHRRRIFCLSSALFRSPFSSGRNLEWDYARCHPIQLNLIQFKSQNTNGNQIFRCFHVVSCYFPCLVKFISSFKAIRYIENKKYNYLS